MESRQRQVSECSDDFICFQYDESNDETSDSVSDEFGESDAESSESASDGSEESDGESSDSGSDELDSKCINIENSPSESNFKVKKVCIFSIRVFSRSHRFVFVLCVQCPSNVSSKM